MTKYDREDLFSVEGKTAVVTGATGHLGSVMALALRNNGARVIGTGRRGDKFTGDFLDEYYRVDFSTVCDLRSFGLDVIKRNQIDILINNAHDMSADAGFNIPIDQIKEAQWLEWVVNIEGAIKAPVMLTGIIGGQMRSLGRGSIINIGTMYGLVAPSPLLYAETDLMNPPGYGATKAALMAFTRYVASFWGRYGVRCNAILPGPFPKKDPSPEFGRRLNNRTCLGRTGMADELVGAVLFLASDASSYVTGHGLVVDGGWTVT